MSEQQTPQINERLWQKWIVKNRELDRRSAVRRVRFLGLVLAGLIIGVAVRH